MFAVEDQDIVRKLCCTERSEDACRSAACYDDPVIPVPSFGRIFLTPQALKSV